MGSTDEDGVELGRIGESSSKEGDEPSSAPQASPSPGKKQRAKSRIELLAEKQAQLPKFQEKMYGPTTEEGVQQLVKTPGELRTFLTSPVPKGMVWQAEILHRHNIFGLSRMVLMIRIDTDEFQSRGSRTPVIFAWKKRKSGTLNYHFMLPDGSLISKLREPEKGNFVLYDDGANPNNNKKSFGKAIRRQIGGCLITNIGALEPIKMRGLFPKRAEGDTMATPRGSTAGADLDYLFHLVQNVDIDKAYFVDTTSSSYSKATGRHTLHYEYSGNVERMASCHNFIMETRDKQKTMQMGKFDKCQYLLDVHHPLTPLQALFLAISHFNG